jgi:hypothetical protein
MQGVKSKQECCSLRSICVVHRAPVGHWARASDEMIWELWSSVRMTASVPNDNGVKWPVTARRASVPNDNGVKWPVTVRRASVLVGLFEGAAGELRVILTKRAGRLSSHSGLHLCPSLWQL